MCDKLTLPLIYTHYCSRAADLNEISIYLCKKTNNLVLKII